MLMQNNQAFENARPHHEAVQAGQTLSSVFHAATTESICAGKAICWEGDEGRHLFQVVEGVVRLHRIIGEGRRVITAFHFAGDVIGASLQGDFLFTAEAVTACKIRRIARKAFHEEVIRSEALRPLYIDLLCQETAAANDQMVLLSKKNAEERLCSFILQLFHRGEAQGRDGLLRVPMSRQDIADYLGLTIETVSRTISKLAARAIISPEGRQDLRLHDLARLSRLAGNADDFSTKNCHRAFVH